jgi:hypothetical protein
VSDKRVCRLERAGAEERRERFSRSTLPGSSELTLEEAGSTLAEDTPAGTDADAEDALVVAVVVALRSRSARAGGAGGFGTGRY